jgi:hypothetical protein
MRQRAFFCASAIAALVTIALWSTGEPLTATGRDTAVTTTIADAIGGYPTRLGSDLQGSYVNSTQVTSIVQAATGDWELTTYYGAKFTPSSRSVFFDLSEPVSSSNPPPPMTAGYVQSHLIAKCHLVNVGFLQIPAGTTVQCPGAFRFEAPNGLWYRLSLQPDNFPEVTRMNVTCLTADRTGCRTWNIGPASTIVTGTDPNPKGVQQLVQIDPNTDAVIATLGDYYVSFAITVSR